MKHAVGLGLALVLGGTAEAAEPSVTGLGAKAPAPAMQPAAEPTRKRLDLRVGKIQDLMMPRDLEAMIRAPDYEKDAVVVEGKRELLPMKFEQPVPAGFPPATLWWALKNPSQSWRILLPDLNAPAAGPVEDKVPPRVFRWGP
jgi:hypothetical protein